MEQIGLDSIRLEVKVEVEVEVGNLRWGLGFEILGSESLWWHLQVTHLHLHLFG